MRRLILSLTVLPAILSCAPPRPSANAGDPPTVAVLPSDSPSIRGTITRRTRGQMLIEEEPLEQSGSAKASVRLTDSTRIVRASGERGSPDDLLIGQQVSAWFEGPVMESYPLQATAGTVRIDAEVP